MLPRLVLTDARAAAAVLLVQRAIDWYIDEAATAQSPPISAQDARALRAALAGSGPWQPELFDRLMTFGQAMYKLTELGHGPGSNVADALTALGTIDITPSLGAGPAAAADASWQFDPRVDAPAFAKLEFRETSVGIEKAQRDNREGWWAHAQRNRAFILDAVKDLPRRRRVVVLGAGSPFDLPLADLARQFEQVLLVDIDEAALASTLKLIWKNPAERAHVTTLTLDLTGINGVLVHRLDDLLAAPAAGADELEARLSRLCRSYRLATPPRWSTEGAGATEPADLVISSCVISQLAWPQRTYAERGFEARFGPMPAAIEARWSTAWTELGLRVQQDHINALADVAGTVVLTSDVISHRTGLDSAGNERDTGRKALPLGVQGLRERIPSSYQIVRHALWQWSRYRPNRKGTEGSRMDVEGVVLRAAPAPGPVQTSSGLWLPGTG